MYKGIQYPNKYLYETPFISVALGRARRYTANCEDIIIVENDRTPPPVRPHYIVYGGIVYIIEMEDD